MIIHTLCPKCKQPIDIDVSKQINHLVEQRAKDKAEQLADRKLLQMKPVLEKQIRTDERKNITKDSAKLQETNDRLSQQNTKLTKALEKQGRTVETKADQLAQQRFQEWQNQQAEDNLQKDLEVAELRKQLKGAERVTHELKVKLQQGSAQTQGLIAENDLYVHLQKHLSSDSCSVEKIGQGRKGTDILLRVHKNNEPAGTIIVEGKWGNKWDREWPEKVWKDAHTHSADIAYIAAKAAAFPSDPSLQQAGFGCAPSRRAGIQVYLINQSNMPLVINILNDGIQTLLMRADIEASYGTNSDQLKQFQAYLARGYQNDLREKANHMSAALKSLQDLHDKVDREYGNIKKALGSYWATERQQFQSLMAPWNTNKTKDVPQLPYIKGL